MHGLDGRRISKRKTKAKNRWSCVIVSLLNARVRLLKGRFLRITGQRLRFYQLHNVSNKPEHFRLDSTYKPSSRTVTLTFSYVNARRAAGLFPVMPARCKIMASSKRCRLWSKRISGRHTGILIVQTRLSRALWAFDSKIIRGSYRVDRISILNVSGLGLLLGRLVFESYNAALAVKSDRGRAGFEKYEKGMEEFKQREIYERI